MTFSSVRAMKSVSALVGAMVLAALLSGCGGTSYDASAKPTINDQEALTQVTRLFEDVLEKNKADLKMSVPEHAKIGQDRLGRGTRANGVPRRAAIGGERQSDLLGLFF